MKKILALAFALVFASSTLCFAAVSSSKGGSSAPAPRPPSTTQMAPTPAPSTSQPQSGSYKPSAPASSYGNTAPAAQTPAAQSVPQPNTGGFMRNIGLFGGGMLLGSMLGGMFGFGNSGMFASIAGMLFNVILLAGIFMAGRYLWTRFRQSRNNSR